VLHKILKRLHYSHLCLQLFITKKGLTEGVFLKPYSEASNVILL